MRRLNSLRRAISGALGLLLCTSAYGQAAAPRDIPEPGELVNFAYSAILGTGYYRVGERSIYAVQMPLAWQVREPTIREDGTSASGKRWLLPVSLGLLNFSPDLEEGFPTLDSVGNLTVLPGIEFSWLRPSGWLVRANTNLGVSLDLESDERAGVTELTVRGRYVISPLTHESVGIEYGQRFTYTAYKPENESSNSLGYVSLGLDFRWQQDWQVLGRTANVGATFYGDFYFNKPGFAIPLDDLEEIDRVFTVGVSVGAERGFEVLGIPFDRLGLGYRFGPGVRAVTVFADFPF